MGNTEEHAALTSQFAMSRQGLDHCNMQVLVDKMQLLLGAPLSNGGERSPEIQFFIKEVLSEATRQAASVLTEYRRALSIREPQKESDWEFEGDGSGESPETNRFSNP